MDDNRKLAVAFGNFACVVEGYDRPFEVMREVVRFFEEQAGRDPGFGDWSSLSDAEGLSARLAPFADGAMAEIVALPGGLRLRRLMDDAVAADERAEETEAEELRPSPFAEDAGEAEAETEAEPEEDAWSDAAPTAAAQAGADWDRDGDEGGRGYGASPFAEDTDDDATDHDDRAEAGGADLDDEPDHFHAEDETSPDWADEAPETLAHDAEAMGEEPAADEAWSDADTGADWPDETADEEETAATGDRDREADSAHGFSSYRLDPSPDAEDSSASRWDEDGNDEDDYALAKDDAHRDDEADEDHGEDETDEDHGEDDDRREPYRLDAEEIDADEGEEEEEDDDRLEEEDEDTREPYRLDAEDDDHFRADHVEEDDEDEDEEDHAPPLRLGEKADAPAPLRLGDAPARPASGPAPLRLGGDAPAAPLRLTPEPAAPLRLGEVAAAADSPAPQPPRPLFLRPSAATAADGDAPAEKPAALRLGGDAPADDRPSFIDTIAGAAAIPEPEKPAAPAPKETEIRSELGRALDEGEGDSGRGLRLGGLLRRRPAPQDDAPEPEAAAEEEAPAAATPDDDAAPARKPGSLLRIVAERGQAAEADEEDAAPAPAPEAKPAARSGFRSFLRGRSGARDEDAAAQPAPAPAPAAADPEEAPLPPAAARTAEPEADRPKDRLMAGLADIPDPEPAPSFTLDDPADGEVDAYSPLGFAQRASARSLPELMTAAAAYLTIVEGRSTVSRSDISDVVQQIAGDAPLTAKAKVEAVGKLVRAGTLVRLEGGLFMLEENALQSYREALDGAA